MAKSILIYLPVFNSYKNLNKIFKNIDKTLKNYEISVVIIDNNSENLSKTNKIKHLKELKFKYKKIRTTLVINRENYGIGGSIKIMTKMLKLKKYNYIISLLTSGRYDSLKVLNDIKKKINSNYDYILFSRFIRKEDTKNYNKLRYYFNLFFIKLTVILTGCKFKDPGSITFLMNPSVLKKIKFNDITNGSQFGHFLNILINKLELEFLEIPIKWGEGNIKSHLQSLPYISVLLISLIKFSLTGSFFKEKRNFFKFDKF